jgi:hypothetical protein
MFKKTSLIIIAALFSFSLLAGCASVPMAPKEQDLTLKAFPQPAADKSGLYVYRIKSFVGGALKKNIYVDKVMVGETAPGIYFYKEITPGQHEISTESEFSDNVITLQAEGGKNYFCQQYIKMGVFVGGANVVMVSEEEGKAAIRKCGLAK